MANALGLMGRMPQSTNSAFESHACEGLCDAALADGANGVAVLAATATDNVVRLMLGTTSFSALLSVSVVGVHRVSSSAPLALP